METAKNLIAVITGIVGIATALITLYAKYLDVKKADDRQAHPADPIQPAMPASSGPLPPEDPRRRAHQAPDPGAISRARLAVKGPAISLMVLGFVSLLFNLLIAGYGVVDRYVTPLSDETRARRASESAGGDLLPAADGTARPGGGDADDWTALVTIMTCLGGSPAGLAAAWAGFGMIRLRSYWLSVAGSFAIMAVGPCCFAIGIPIGIWSLAVLFRPEVASSFS